LDSLSHINLLIIKLERHAEKSKIKKREERRGERKGDRKRNQGMNLFMDGAESNGDGRASGGINAKLAIHTKSAWVQVKRGEYISPGINLFELGLHWNNWTLQRAMISKCSCGRRERERKRERVRGEGKEIDISTFRQRRGLARSQATIRRDGKIKKVGEVARDEMRNTERKEKMPRDDKYQRCVSHECNFRETYATACDRHPREFTDLFRRMRRCQ